MELTDIHFTPRLPLEQHPRYQDFRSLIGSRDFAAYREVFERGWAETSIMCGEFVRLQEIPITPEPPPSTLLVNLMGVNDHSPKRVGLLGEFLQQYERQGRSNERQGRSSFMKQLAFNTRYVKDLIAGNESRVAHVRGIRKVVARWGQKRRIRRRLNSFLNLYENMKRFGSLVGEANAPQSTPTSLSPGDVPWAIDYRGYVKLREGSHRRAAAHYLGWEAIPTLVFEFDRLTEQDLQDAHPWVRDNFGWFAATVGGIAAVVLETRRSEP